MGRMLVLGPVIGCAVSNSARTNACETCGHENPAGLTARWCGVCGAQLPDPARARARVGGTQSEPPAGRSSSNGSQGARANGRWSVASGPFRLAVAVVVFAVLLGVVVVTTDRDRLAEPPANPDDDVEAQMTMSSAPLPTRSTPPRSSSPRRFGRSPRARWSGRTR